MAEIDNIPKQATRKLWFDIDYLAVLINRGSYTENVQNRSDVDEQPVHPEMSAGANPVDVVPHHR